VVPRDEDQRVVMVHDDRKVCQLVDMRVEIVYAMAPLGANRPQCCEEHPR
jgi:hypothetical protein